MVSATSIARAFDTESSSVKAGALAAGDLFQFGSYPQSLVSDQGTIEGLNSIDCEMTNYGYIHSSTSIVDMSFCDIEYEGDIYRKVYFSQYRPESVKDSTELYYHPQKNNNYFVDTAYYFLWEPLVWQAVDVNSDEVYALSKTVIDGRIFDSSTSALSIWCDSELNCFLNREFYTYSFTDVEKSGILQRHNENEYCGDKGGFNKPSDDYVWIPSYSEMVNENYGFSSSFEEADTARTAVASEYAKCQGLKVDDKNAGTWWLRSTKERATSFVSSCEMNGTISKLGHLQYNVYGVRPAMLVDSEAVVVKSLDVDDRENSYSSSTTTSRTIKTTEPTSKTENISVTDSVESTKDESTTKNNSIAESTEPAEDEFSTTTTTTTTTIPTSAVANATIVTSCPHANTNVVVLSVASATNNGVCQNVCASCGAVVSDKKTLAIKSVKLTSSALYYAGQDMPIPNVVVTDTNDKAIDSSNYSVKCVSRSNGSEVTSLTGIGQYKLVVDFCNKYTGSKTLYFSVKPKPVKAVALKSKKNSVNVNWQRDNQATGYQIVVATNRAFTKNKKTINVTGKSTKYAMKKLKKGKTYFVKIRAYKTVLVDGKKAKMYSSFSAKKSIKL